MDSRKLCHLKQCALALCAEGGLLATVNADVGARYQSRVILFCRARLFLAPMLCTQGLFHAGLIMKRTYQASKTRRARTHGFLVRMKTRGGRAVINARRAKGRKRLAV